MLSLKDINPRGKTVFLRLDLNVPLDDRGNITDDTRIRAALPTISYLIEAGAKIIAASHLGRPKGEVVSRLSLRPVADRLSSLLSLKAVLAPDSIGPEVESMKSSLKEGEILLLENLRFHPGEKKNSPDFVRGLAEKIDIYINDAFGTMHRAHASVVGIPALIPVKTAGFLVNKEISFLNRLIHDPEKPFAAILGGAKVSDKIPVISNLIQKADSLLIGGAMAYTFFAAQGLGVGRSLVEEGMSETALELIKKADKLNCPIHLPLDHITALAIDKPESVSIIEEFPFPDRVMALDIGPKTIEAYLRIISQAKTIFWNGPMGVFEKEAFSQGTMALAQGIAASSAFSIVGGGDSVSAISKAGVEGAISHVSTGGGASLEYIADETLPGINALMEK